MTALAASAPAVTLSPVARRGPGGKGQGRASKPSAYGRIISPRRRFQARRLTIETSVSEYPTDRYRSFTADWARAGHARAPYGVAVILNAMSSLNAGRVIVTPLPARVVTDELVIVVPVAVS